VHFGELKETEWLGHDYDLRVAYLQLAACDVKEVVDAVILRLVNIDVPEAALDELSGVCGVDVECV